MTRRDFLRDLGLGAAALPFVLNLPSLGFANQGARLRLSVRGPDGKAREQEGTSTLTVDVPDAAPGDWTYTVIALKVPYPNFPFTLTVGGD